MRIPIWFQESSVEKVSWSLCLKSHSCPTVFEFLEDIEFDDQFELLLFETKSESATGSTIINPDFIKYLEVEQANRSIDDYILNLQNSIVATNIPEFIESSSETLGPSVVTSDSQVRAEPSFIPTIPVQPSIFDQQSEVIPPPSSPHTSYTYFSYSTRFSKTDHKSTKSNGR